MPFLSPLRYPGSKRRFGPYIETALKLNGLRPHLYVEPFAGGASVALHLLHNDAVDQVVLMDKDPLVSSFWRVVFHKDPKVTQWLLDEIDTLQITVEQWHEFKNTKPTTIRHKALQCLFLNRTSFSGLLTPDVGPIGGRDQTSAYPIDCRFNKETIKRRIQQLAQFRDRVPFVWTIDWHKGMTRLQTKQQNGRLPSGNVFFYFDPPYFEKAEKLYPYYFAPKQHEQLRDFILNLNTPWILSYDSAEKFKQLYARTPNGRSKIVELFYSASISGDGERSLSNEVIFSNLPNLPPDARLWRYDRAVYN